MKRVVTWLAAAVVLCAAAFAVTGCDMPSTGGLGQVGGSGNVITRQYDFTGFTKVVVDNGFQADIAYGDSYSVEVRVDDNLVQDNLKVELDGDTLHVGLAPLWRYHDITAEARVVLPRIVGLEASGGSQVTVTGFSAGDPLALDASGSSRVEMVRSTFGAVTLDVSGASRVEGTTQLDGLAGEVSGGSALRLGGAASRLSLDASGGSDLGLLDLTAESADLALSGGSDAEVTVTGVLTVDASGGSRLRYAGDPQVNVDTSGGAEVERY